MLLNLSLWRSYTASQEVNLFDVVSVPPKGFTSMLKVVRNVLVLDINSANKPEIKIQKDVFATDQLVVTIAAKGDLSAANIISKNKEKLQQLFDQEEISRKKLVFYRILIWVDAILSYQNMVFL